jgi:hypothetical protein
MVPLGYSGVTVKQYKATSVTVQQTSLGKQPEINCLCFSPVLKLCFYVFGWCSFSLSTPLGHLGRSRGVAPLILDFGLRWS